MSSRNAPRLDPGLIARKGEAAPAAPPTAPVPTVPVQAAAGAPAPQKAAAQAGLGERADDAPIAARGLHGTIAVTVRLDPKRYERLKVHGARRRRTNQDILVEALDRYFRDIED